MRADEFITEGKQVLVEAKGHLDHPEDLVLLQGSAGAEKALKAMSDTISNPSAVTIKWDGYPALLWGYGPDGKFSVMDKHMFNKGTNSPSRFIHSPEAFAKYDLDRGSSRDVAQTLAKIWKELYQITPKVSGYFWGDVLFTQPLTPEKDGMYHFKPNPHGIKYTVEANSPVGEKYFKDKHVGIAVHQFVDVNANNTENPLTKHSLNGTTGGIGEGKYLSILPAAMPQIPVLKLNQRLLNATKSTIASSGPGMDQFFKDSPQTKPKIGPSDSALRPSLTEYINAKVREGNFNNLVAGFIPFLNYKKAEGKLTRPMAAKLLGYVDPETNKQVPGFIQTHINGLKDVFKVWTAIYNFKMSIVPQLNKAAETAPVQGYLDNGTRSQEGFVSHGLKFIDRLGFSRQNLAGRQPPATLTEDVNKQMLVIYPGGFHPFHLGHASVFDHLAKKFDDGEVFVAATDTTTERPFEFTDKSFLANQSGVPKGRFVQVKSPYRSTEITQNYDPNNTVLVFAVSEKDHDRISFKPKKDGSPSYFQPYQSGDLTPMSQHGYIYVVPKIDFKIADETIDSASKIRKMYAAADDQQRQRIIGDLYPHAKAPKRIKEILDRVLGGLTESRITNKQQELSAIMEYKKLVDSGRVSMDEWITLIEQYYVSKSLLKESRDESLVNFIQNLKSSCVEDPVVGERYFPLPIHLVRDRMYAYDCDGHSPAKSAPKKCRLVDRNGAELTFMMNGRRQRWPLNLNRELSYATTLCFPDYDSYEKAANLIMLKTGIQIPINDEIKEADNPNYFGGSSQSAIPGTPPDLQPRPSVKKIRRERQQERELQRFMGH